MISRTLLKSALAAAIITGATTAATAQQTAISPTPQRIAWSQKAFDRPQHISLKGAETADTDAVAALLSQFAKGKGVKVVIGERGDKAVRAVADSIPDHPQGYYLRVRPGEVIIAGNDPTGTYYGVQTFLQVASQPEVMSVDITDWPSTPFRGVVEGFYGNAWSFDDRVDQFAFYGRNKLDTYIYGPKDDPYHRAKWRELYPAEEAARMKALNDEARRHKVRFVWGIHPAGDHQWNDADNEATVRKFEQMYDLGFRNFSIFFDDVFGKQADGKLHAQYMDYVKRHFIDRHPDIELFIMCPSLYNKAWKGSFQPSYLADISVMDPSIKVMWTGNSVVDMIDVADMEWINPQIGREAFIWLNYPVTDYCINHLLMGPFTGNEPEATAMVSGFTANPMEYARASKLSLFSNADFLWNPSAYDPQKSWLLATERLQPGRADAFRKFCLYNVDLGQNTHRLRRLNESPELKALIDAYEHPMSRAYLPEAAEAFAAEFAALGAAATTLLEAAPTDSMLTEIRPWIEVARMLGRRGVLVTEMYNDLFKADSVSFVRHYLDYASLTDSASKIASRDFPGSVKVAYPMVGSLYAEPLLRRGVSIMTDEYRHRFGYRTDVFPQLALENGSYRLRHDGKWLGNPDAGSTGGRPVWQTAEDDVNPDRQIWRVTYDPATGRYSLVNAKDGRYVNERGAFTVSDTSNPFDAEWHTFVIERTDNGFTLRQGGNAGKKYLTPDSDGLAPAEAPATIEFIPVK